MRILIKINTLIKAKTRYHLLIKNKIMIINIFIMSFFKYVLRFLKISIKIKNELNEKY